MTKRKSKKFSVLDADARNALPDRAFAWISPDGERHLPIQDRKHVIAALSRVSQTQGLAGAAKARALDKIRAAAKRYGVQVKAATTDMDGDDDEEPDESEDDTRPGDQPIKADDAPPAGGPTLGDVHVPGPMNQTSGKLKRILSKVASADVEQFDVHCCMDACGKCQGAGCGCCGSCFIELTDADGDDDGDENAENMGDGNPQEGEIREYKEGSAHFTASDGTGARMFIPFTGGEWIQYIPAPGKWESPRFGTIQITAERNARFVDNFKRRVYQEHIPIDAEHETKLSGALGWVEDMRVNPDGSVGAYASWTDRGEQMLKSKRFRYFSPEWYDRWRDPATGKVIEDVAIGGAVTTKPFFKASSLQPVVASEQGFEEVSPITSRKGQSKMNEEDIKRFTELEDELGKAKADAKVFAEKLTASEEAAQAAETKAQALVARLDTIERDNRSREFTEIAREFPGKTEDHVSLMEILDDDGRAKYVALQTAAAEQLKAASLFNPVGSSQHQSQGSKVEEVRQAAEARIKNAEGNITPARAMADAWTPEAYAEYLKESGN